MQNHPKLRRFLILVGIFLLCITVVYVARRPLMRAAGHFLVKEDSLALCDAIFVLSGNPNDRSLEAARLYKAGFAPRIICTGESIQRILLCVGDSTDEADLSRLALLDAGIPDEHIEALHIGTSTREESDAILVYCKARGLKKIMVVSDKFHTRRINFAFRKHYQDAGIELVLRGCPHTAYSEDLWWGTEDGLIVVNNEYVKLLYYYIRH